MMELHGGIVGAYQLSRRPISAIDNDNAAYHPES
jgi:hypothetical protein